jgi:molybdopterin-guanine dinucleotide biosynthesis protein A
MPPVAVLLAGGLATRMGGGDKPLRLLGGAPLLSHVIARIRPQVQALAVAANGDPARFAAWGLPVIADPVPGCPGPLAGVLAGMRWAAAIGAADLLSVPADTPFLPANLVERLEAARRAGGSPIACAASNGRRHPTVALWPAALADALEAALRAGARKVADWASAYGLAEADFDAATHDPFFNVNSPGDLAAAEAVLRAGGVEVGENKARGSAPRPRKGAAPP